MYIMKVLLGEYMWECRIITVDFSFKTEDIITNGFTNILKENGCNKFSFSEFIPYWKIVNYGEISVKFDLDKISCKKLKNSISKSWDNDTSLKNFNTIFQRKIVFVWLSSE